jgi:hypothetical protein
MTTAERANADRCADYLLNKRDHLDFPTAVAKGWPIATGVIEDACRACDRGRTAGWSWRQPLAQVGPATPHPG